MTETVLIGVRERRDGCEGSSENTHAPLCGASSSSPPPLLPAPPAEGTQGNAAHLVTGGYRKRSAFFEKTPKMVILDARGFFLQPTAKVSLFPRNVLSNLYLRSHKATGAMEQRLNDKDIL